MVSLSTLTNWRTLVAVVAVAGVATWIGYNSAAHGDSIALELADVSIDDYTDAGESSCSAFRITEADVRQYFKAIKSAPKRQYADDLYSPCKMNGKLTLKNGESGTYIIQSSGIGSFTTDGGETRTIFAKPTWDDPNEGGYFNRGD